MDALKKVIGGNHGSGSTNAPAAGAGGQKDDLGDKGKIQTNTARAGAAYINKTYLGNKLSRDQLERTTDAGREYFEKSTGKQVPSKISN
ncbi:hypothetical protein NUW58_g8481 [Xylaria curta]|uniref:Uncharacterized protein n=1 Tax=Xylaria curta TaxID=42375 RepID=A0ACC1N6U9_9PEZI|nr:hypothetical protein NUW58_g8481 [Xylaria curta]